MNNKKSRFSEMKEEVLNKRKKQESYDGNGIYGPIITKISISNPMEQNQNNDQIVDHNDEQVDERRTLNDRITLAFSHLPSDDEDDYNNDENVNGQIQPVHTLDDIGFNIIQSYIDVNDSTKNQENPLIHSEKNEIDTSKQQSDEHNMENVIENDEDDLKLKHTPMDVLLGPSSKKMKSETSEEMYDGVIGVDNIIDSYFAIENKEENQMSNDESDKEKTTPMSSDEDLHIKLTKMKSEKIDLGNESPEKNPEDVLVDDIDYNSLHTLSHKNTKQENNEDEEEIVNDKSDGEWIEIPITKRMETEEVHKKHEDEQLHIGQEHKTMDIIENIMEENSNEEGDNMEEDFNIVGVDNIIESYIELELEKEGNQLKKQNVFEEEIREINENEPKNESPVYDEEIQKQTKQIVDDLEQQVIKHLGTLEVDPYVSPHSKATRNELRDRLAAKFKTIPNTTVVVSDQPDVQQLIVTTEKNQHKERTEEPMKRLSQMKEMGEFNFRHFDRCSQFEKFNEKNKEDTEPYKKEVTVGGQFVFWPLGGAGQLHQTSGLRQTKTLTQDGLEEIIVDGKVFRWPTRSEIARKPRQSFEKMESIIDKDNDV
ncbi:hypothetical protein QTN25_007057 [Entamoeba marina]